MILITWLKQFNSCKVPAVIDCTVIVSELGRCVLLFCMYDLKATKECGAMWYIIHEVMLFEFELGHYAAEPTKNICCTESDSIVDHSRVTRFLKKFRTGFKYLDDQGRSTLRKAWIVLAVWHINHCWLRNAKPGLFIYSFISNIQDL